MPFLDHLEELRWRILKSLAAIVVGAAICLTFSERLIKVLTYPYEDAVLSMENGKTVGAVGAVEQLLEQWLGTQSAAPADSLPRTRELPPGRRLQSLRPVTYLMVSMEVGLWGGVVLALPVVLYQLWMFVGPGLFRRERRVVLPVVAMSVGCFALGAMVAYWLVLPLGLRFFLALEPPGMTSQWAVDQYISFVVRMLMGFGLVFELPVLSLLLSRIGLITPQLLRRVRRYSIVVIFVVAAVLTPPDPLSQVLLATPLLLLYEVSIWISSLASPKRR
jgi:sec-independent protein translocase protein TatC